MIEIEIGKSKIKLYHAAEELPIQRYARFQKYNIIESGIGSDIESIGKHFSRLFEFQRFKMNEEAIAEAKNLYYTFFLMLEEIPITGLAFACLVHSINGETLNDISEDNLKAVIKQLSDLGLSQKIAAETVAEVKKKFIMS